MKLLLTTCLFLCIIHTIHGAVDYPDISKAIENGYEANVEITDLLHNEIRMDVREYFLNPLDTGRLDMKMLGMDNTVFYWKSKDQIVQIYKDSGSCSIQTFSNNNLTTDLFYWKWATKFNDRDLIGPLGILFSLQKESPPVYYHDTEVRGIPANVFKKNFQTNDKTENVDVLFYFAKKEAALPYQQQAPLRIMENGTVKGQKIETLIEISFFKGIAPSLENFQIPYGFGCEGLKPEPGVPKLPEQYSYTAEVLSKTELITSENLNAYKVVKNVEPHFVLYQQYSLDNYNSYEIHDFESGVLYKRTGEGSCTYDAIRDDSMAIYPAIVEAKEKDKTVYKIGTTNIRGIECDIYEHVHEDDAITAIINKPRIVVTRFFSRNFSVALEEDAEARRIPVQVLITGYVEKKVEGDQEKKWEEASKIYINIFNFKSKWNSLPLDYNVEKCFKKPSQRRYFEIQFAGGEKMTRNAEEVEATFRKAIMDYLVNEIGIFSLRIPFVNIQFKAIDVYVQIMILEEVKVVDGMDEGSPQFSLEELTYYLPYQVAKNSIIFEIPSAEKKDDPIIYTSTNMYAISLDTFVKKRRTDN